MTVLRLRFSGTPECRGIKKARILRYSVVAIYLLKENIFIIITLPEMLPEMVSMKSLPFNACDYRCERCLVTAECAVFQKLQERLSMHKIDCRDENELSIVLEDIRESFRETEKMIKQKARDLGIDIDEIAGTTTAVEIEDHIRRTREDPLYKRSEEFTMEAHRFLRDADPAIAKEAKEYFDDIAWHHTMVSAKIFRALGWRTDDDDLIAADGKNSAAVAMKSLTICGIAFDHLASRYSGIADECNRLSRAGREIKEEIRQRFRP